MYLLLFNIYTAVLIFLDVRNYRNHLTPLAIVGGVYLLLIDINNLIITRIYNFYPVSTYVLMMLSIFFLWIFIIDLLFGCTFKSHRKVGKSLVIKFKSYRTIVVLFLIGVAAYTLQFIRLYRSYGLEIKGMNNGILGHLSSLAFVLGPLSVKLAFQKKRKSRICLTLFLNTIVLMISGLFGGKYVIFINLTYFILFFVLQRDRKVKLKKLIKIGILLVCVAIFAFFIIYFVIPRATGKYESSLSFVIRHTIDYLLGPIVANNYTMTNPGMADARIPYAVVINIIKALFRNGDYVSGIYPFVFAVTPTDVTNVSGFFGELVYCSGLVMALLYVGIVFVLINMACVSYRLKGSYYLTYCYSFAVLPFLFFGNFFSVSGVVLPLLLALLFDILSNVKVENAHI